MTLIGLLASTIITSQNNEIAHIIEIANRPLEIHVLFGMVRLILDLSPIIAEPFVNKNKFNIDFIECLLISMTIRAYLI